MYALQRAYRFDPANARAKDLTLFVRGNETFEIWCTTRLTESTRQALSASRALPLQELQKNCGRVIGGYEECGVPFDDLLGRVSKPVAKILGG